VYPELHREADRVSLLRPKPCAAAFSVGLHGNRGRSSAGLVFQIMDVINDNEAHFLSSLQQGSRLIHRALHREDYKHGVFPGRSPSAT